MSLNDKLPHYIRLMRIDKPIGTLLLLWPTLWALWLAPAWHRSTLWRLARDPGRSPGCGLPAARLRESVSRSASR